MKTFSHVQLFATPWTIAYQAPPSMGFSRQEYWSGLPFPSAEDLTDPGSNLCLSHCRQTLYCLSHQGSLVDRVPKELWMEAHNTVQEAVTKTIPKKKKCKKAKWLSEEALQIAEEIREVSSKGERESYIQLNRVPENSKRR